MNLLRIGLWWSLLCLSFIYLLFFIWFGCFIFCWILELIFYFFVIFNGELWYIVKVLLVIVCF